LVDQLVAPLVAPLVDQLVAPLVDQLVAPLVVQQSYRMFVLLGKCIQSQ